MKTLFHTFVILTISFSINAQQKIDFDFDYAQFAYDSSSNYLELYYSFGQRGLAQIKNDSAVLLEGILDIEIKDTSTQELVVDREWKINHEIKDTLDMNRSLVGILSFILPAGEYTCSISGRNPQDASVSRNYSESLTVEPFIDTSFAVSNIQFASKILQDSPNKNSVFYKNSYEVIPLPTSILGENQPVLFHYFELYNLKDENNNVPLKLNTVVINSRREIFFSKTKDISKNTNSRVEVGTVLINKFPTDTYTIIISLYDSTKNFSIASSKRFYVLNPSVAINDSSFGEITDVFSTHFGAMSEEELDDLFDKSKYIATSQEIDQYNSLTEKEGKQKFIYQFWNARDTEPSTPQNEFYLNYQKRIEISNQQFAALGKKGWKTDRGRIFLKYGEPSEIERFPNQIDTKPYEIWHYNEIEGGVIFIFADLTNFSDYQLIHSTARGELRDDNWYRRIRSI